MFSMVFIAVYISIHFDPKKANKYITILPSSMYMQVVALATLVNALLANYKLMADELLYVPSKSGLFC